MVYKYRGTLILILVFFSFCFGNYAHAVMPPDFIFNAASQVAQIFGLVLFFLSTTVTIFYKFVSNSLAIVKRTKFLLPSAILMILLLSAGITYIYTNYKQRSGYEKWLVQSEQYSEELKANELNTPEGSTDLEEIDKLTFNDSETVPRSGLINITDRFVSNLEGGYKDKNIEFIERYYGHIANGRLKDAYDLSKKTVGYTTFQAWYEETTKIILDKLVRIDEHKSSLELTLFDGEVYTRYGVLMTLGLENGDPIRVEKSEVRVLGHGSVAQGVTVIQSKDTDDFFIANKTTSLAVTNQEFQQISTSGRGFLVLDAREDIEFKNGNFPNSIHIRFADLKAGRWIELPMNRPVYVICWSGIRGKEVAEFLRTKKIVASYLENGAEGWVAFGGAWVGSIGFSDTYSELKYRTVFETEKLRDMIQQGVMVVDSREPNKYKSWHIPGSVNIAMMYTPSIRLSEVFGQIPPNSNVITLCDAYVNCFDAKVTGVELERRGHQFLGRYNKPWEYQHQYDN